VYYGERALGGRMKRKVIYYKDELSDDFSGVTRKTIKIDDKYKYIKKNILWKMSALIVYRIFIVPFAYLYMKLKFHHKCVNINVLKKRKKSGKGCFVYGNHTLMAGDAFIPNLINLPRRTYTVVHPDNISVKITKPIIEMCGALPLPDTITATRNFLEAMDVRLREGCVIQIYPEAHVWPYYTRIRPFGSSCFRYPIKLDVPVFCITNTYHKRKLSKIPKVVTYIDGPFVVDKNLPPKEQEQRLRDMVFDAMCERSKNTTYEYYEYKKEENTID